MKRLVCMLSILFAQSSWADDQWHSFSLSYLNGEQYKLGPKNRQIATFEYAARYDWGDSFLFFDHIRPESGDATTYGEWAPRYAIGPKRDAFVKQHYLAAMVEMGAGFTHYLYGIGTGLSVPGFRYFNANVYYRQNEIKDNNYQLTLTWAIPFADNRLLYDGFIDYTSATDMAATSMNFTSQLKYDLAKSLGLSSSLFLGIEYVFWNNKFGVDGINERNANLLIKYHF